jgi:hypothetical protein
MTARPGTYPDRSAAELARIRAAYVDSAVSVVELCNRFKMRQPELYMLIEREGWQNRGGASRAHMVAKATARSGPKPKTQAELIAERRAKEAARDLELYGDALPAVRYLRRNFAIHKDGDVIVVGNKRLTPAEAIAMADRERRVAGAPAMAAPSTPTGLKIGDRQALTPKKPPPKAAPAAAPKPKELTGAALTKKQNVERASTDLGEKPRVVWLDLSLLKVDRRYQRDIGKAGLTHINAILREFNWSRYQPIVVSERSDGTYAVIDGQHRFEAAKKHPLIDQLPCYIVAAPDIAAEASIFSAVNSRRLSLTSQQKFWAAHAAGDERATAVYKLCAAAGVKILRTPPSYDIPARSILAPFTLQKVLSQVGKSPLGTALKLLAETHSTTLNAFRSPTIVALARICAGKEFSASRMKAALQALDLSRLYDDARNARVSGGGTLETATERVLRRHYEARAGA